MHLHGPFYFPKALVIGCSVNMRLGVLKRYGTLRCRIRMERLFLVVALAVASGTATASIPEYTLVKPLTI